MPIEKIEKISSALKKIVEAPSKMANLDHFEALMKQRTVKAEPIAMEKVDVAGKMNSPMDEVREIGRKQGQVNSTSPYDLASQTQDVVAQIDTLKNKLQTPDLNLKGSVKTILRNKLEHIDESLQIAISKSGGEHTGFDKPTGLMSPIDRFLGMLTHSQTQLQSLASDVVKLQGPDGNITPANMLLIQIKVGHISQEIELFTSMLNKALESTKAIMNVQV
jgi:hypothetical protein